MALTSLLGVAAVNDTFVIDDLLYTVLTETETSKTVKVQSVDTSLQGHVALPASVTHDDTEYILTTLQAEAFKYCTELLSISIPETITSINGTSFYRCSNLESITVADNNSNYASEDGILFNKEGTSILICPNGKTGKYDIPETVKTIGNSCFNGCSKLSSITIPSSIQTIGNYAFELCSSLKTVTIPASSKITSSPFGRCSSLESIIVEDGNQFACSIDGVLYSKDMTNLWQYPPAKKGEYEFPETVTKIGDFAFSCSEYLTTTNIPKEINTISNAAYSYCPNLTQINVSDDNTKYCSVDGVLFNKAKDQLITFPGGITGDYVIPYGVKTLSGNAFRGAKISTVIIPATVTTITLACFEDCENLTKLIDLCPTPQNFITNTVHNTPEDMVVYVPKDYIDAYQKAWPFLNNFEEIETFMVALPDTKDQMTVGESIELKVNIVSVDNSTVNISSEIWSSSNTSVASVDQSGRVTALKAGTTTIKVTVTSDTNQVSTDECLITVSPTADIEYITTDSFETIDYSKPYNVYDLSGKKLTDKVDNLQPGIYLVLQHGKTMKIVVK